MNLLPLSLTRVTKHVPRPLTNDERARLLRAALPSPAYNEHDWEAMRESRQREAYWRAEMMDAREPSTDTHYRSR